MTTVIADLPGGCQRRSPVVVNETDGQLTHVRKNAKGIPQGSLGLGQPQELMNIMRVQP